MQRRHFIATTGVGVGLSGVEAGAAEDGLYKVTKGRVKQSVVHWCFNPMPVGELAAAGQKMGLGSVELVGKEHWGMLKELGLTCAIAGSHGFAKGFAHVEEHEECIASLRQKIDDCHDHGVPAVITFSGFRRGLAQEVGMKNMIEGLKKVVGYAEEKGINICLEMLNSRVDEKMKGHPDYWCDHIGYALEVCKAISSPRMKLLFDIYHVQIMDGDVIRWLQACGEYTGHIHTAGNPGRQELDDEQEINYAGIMKAIAGSGYAGFVGHEFIPRGADKLKALSDAVRLCDV